MSATIRRGRSKLPRGETVCTLDQAAIILDAPIPAVRRWITRGSRGVRLEGKWDSGRREWITTNEACLRFLVRRAA